jgi:hypothetical protein
VIAEARVRVRVMGDDLVTTSRKCYSGPSLSEDDHRQLCNSILPFALQLSRKD